MLKIKGETIHCNRGDKGTIKFKAQKLDGSDYDFQKGDKVSFIIVPKGGYTKGPVFRKDVEINDTTKIVNFDLKAEDTKIGDMINKKVKYWYNVVLNDDQTILGSDENGEKEFILYPETGEEGDLSD